MHYISWLLGHEGPGSVLSLLIKRYVVLRCNKVADASHIYDLYNIAPRGYKRSLMFSSILYVKDRK